MEYKQAFKICSHGKELVNIYRNNQVLNRKQPGAKNLATICRQYKSIGATNIKTVAKDCCHQIP